MALTRQQEAFLKVYNEMPAVIFKFFYRRIAKGTIPFMTNAKTINYDVVKDKAIKAKILRRGDKFPVATTRGFKRDSVTPEVLKESVPFDADDQLDMTPGSVYIGGVKIDGRKYQEDKRLEIIKQSISTTMEEIATSVFLKGTYISPDTKNKVTYAGFPTGVNVPKTNIKNWGVWLTSIKNAYLKAGKQMPSETLIGELIFTSIIADFNANPSNAVKVVPTSVMTPDGEELHVNVYGHNLVMMPRGTDTAGAEIDNSNWVMLYHNNAYQPAFAGVKNVVNGKSSMESIDVLIRETSADEETGEAKTLGESAYCPVVTNLNLIKLYKVTGL